MMDIYDRAEWTRDGYRRLKAAIASSSLVCRADRVEDVRCSDGLGMRRTG
jgi:hypothetical protein